MNSDITEMRGAKRPSDMNRETRKKHALAAALCAAVLVLSSFLSVKETAVTIRLGTHEISAPCVCPFKIVTGLDCPVCGLTRSFVALGHLDFRSAWRFNKGGLPAYLFVIFQLFQSLFLLFRERAPAVRARLRAWSFCYAYAIGAICVTGWLFHVIKIP